MSAEIADAAALLNRLKESFHAEDTTTILAGHGGTGVFVACLPAGMVLSFPSAGAVETVVLPASTTYAAMAFIARAVYRLVREEKGDEEL